ncbi:hypothetical protein GGH17_005455, partial [Coemansia sp. RSA 788]
SSYQPSFQLSFQPSYQSSYQPSYQPSYQSSYQPSYQPSFQLSFQPLYQPVVLPQLLPSFQQAPPPVQLEQQPWMQVVQQALLQYPQVPLSFQQPPTQQVQPPAKNMKKRQPAKLQQKADCQYINELSQAQLQSTAGWCVLIDPGQQDLLFAMHEDSSIKKASVPIYSQPAAQGDARNEVQADSGKGKAGGHRRSRMKPGRWQLCQAWLGVVQRVPGGSSTGG